MCAPEPPVQGGQLGELRGEVRSTMERRQGEVAPDEPEAVEAVQERLTGRLAWKQYERISVGAGPSVTGGPRDPASRSDRRIACPRPAR